MHLILKYICKSSYILYKNAYSLDLILTCCQDVIINNNYMRIFKTNPILILLNSYLIDSPQPSTISYLWNFGSLLGLSLIAQIITGILLAMHYQGSAEAAFHSVEHIMRDVNEG